MIKLDVDESISVLFILIEQFSYDKEPMFLLSDKNKKLIESCLNAPFQTFDAHELYPSVEEKVAALFYTIVKGHKLENGNKRTGVILTLFFLLRNDLWLKMNQDGLYKLAISVADSKTSDKDSVIVMLNQIFKDNIFKP